jgi:dTDP-4-dehydrorhamnose 3,5-epimerase
MNIKTTSIPGVFLLEPLVFSDERGHFFESFQQEKFNEMVGENIVFVQDNESVSSKNVVRGLHFQDPPYTQGKLVRVVQGAVLDVAVDIRKSSPTYGKHVSALLTSENRLQLWVPEGFAHGFVALEDDTIFQYKCTNYYHHASEKSLRWNDPELGIDWQTKHPLLSEKDACAPLLADLNSPF